MEDINDLLEKNQSHFFLFVFEHKTLMFILKSLQIQIILISQMENFSEKKVTYIIHSINSQEKHLFGFCLRLFN